MPANPYLQGLSALSVKVKAIFLKPKINHEEMGECVPLIGRRGLGHPQTSQEEIKKSSKYLLGGFFVSFCFIL